MVAVLRAIVTVWLLSVFALTVAAQDERAIRLVVPAPAGGNVDSTARLLAPLMAKRLNKIIIVENRPGAMTDVGFEYVAHSPADARLVLLAPSTLSINSSMHKVSYDPFRDFRPVVQLTRERYVLAVRSDVKADSLQQLAALARTQPAGLNCGAAPGNALIGCEQLAVFLDRKMVSIPFNGAATVLNSLLAGQVDLAFIPVDFAQQHAPGGRIRLLASAGEDRLAAPLAHLPRVAELCPGFSVDGYIGLVVQSQTPADWVARLNDAANFALADPTVRERMAAAGQDLVGGSPEQFERHIRQRYHYFKQVIEKAGIKTP